MPTGGNPYTIPSPIKINYTPVESPTTGLTALMAVQKAIAAQQAAAARAAAAASRARGAGAKYTNYVKLPLGNGDFETVPVVGADKDNRAAQGKELMSRRLAQLAAQDKDLQESLSKMNGLSVKGQKMELDKIRQQHIPRLVKQWGISPELGAEFMKQNTSSIAANIDQQQKAINQTGVLQSFVDSTKMGATALWDAIRSLGSTPDEKFAMGEAQAKQRQEILAQNPHLREEALRAQEGIDSWTDFFDNKALNVAEALGDTLSGAGGIIGTQAGVQALVSGVGKGLMAIPHPVAKAAGVALQTPVVRTIVAAGTGGATGAGLGGMNLANRLVAEVEAGRMTRAEAIDALEKGQLPAQLLGGGVGAAFSTIPAVNLLPKGIPGLTRSAATKRGQDYIRQQAVKASLKEGADSVLARTAGERAVKQAVTDYNTPGILAPVGRYFKALPRTAVDLAAFNAADTLAGNVAYSQATGQPMSMDGVGQAAMAGVAGAPFFAMLGNRAHYNPPSGRTLITGVEEIRPELPPAGGQHGLPEGGVSYRPTPPPPPGRSGPPWWEVVGFENEASYRAAEARAYAEAATRQAEAMRAQNAGRASQQYSAHASGPLWDLLQNFPAPVASDTWSSRQTPGTIWPVNAPSQPPIRRTQQPSAQSAASTPTLAPNPTTPAIRPEVIATINAAQGNAKQWGPSQISTLYRELAIGKLDPDEVRTYMNTLVGKKDQPKQKALAAALAQYDAVTASLERAAKNQVEAPVLKETIKNTDSLPEALEAAITLLERQDITVKEFEDLRKTAKTQDIRRALLQTQRLFENGEISYEQAKDARGDGHEPTPTQDTGSIGSGTTPAVAGNGQLGEGGANPTDTAGNSGAAPDSQTVTPNPADQLPQSPAGGDTAAKGRGDAGVPAQNTGAPEAPAGTPDVKVGKQPGSTDGESGSSPAATEPPAADTGERGAESKTGTGGGSDGAAKPVGTNEPDPVTRLEAEAKEKAADEVELQKQLGVENNTENQDRAKITIAASNEQEGDRFILPRRVSNAVYEVIAPIKVKDKVSVLLNKLNSGELTPDETIAGLYDKTANKGGYYHSVARGGTLSIDKAKELLKLSEDAPDGTPTLLRTITKWEKSHKTTGKTGTTQPNGETLGKIAERIANGEKVSTGDILRAAAADEQLSPEARNAAAKAIGADKTPSSSPISSVEETSPTAPQATPKEAASTFIRNIANLDISPEEAGSTKMSSKSLAEVKSIINTALDAGVKPEELKKRVLFTSPHNTYNQEILDTIVAVSRTHKPKTVPVTAAQNTVSSGSALKAWIENPLNMKINDKGPNFIEGPRAVFRNMNYGEAVEAATKLEWKVATDGYDKLGKREREKYNALKMLGMPNFDKVAVDAAVGEAEAKAQSEGRKFTRAEINDDAYNLFMTSREEARSKMNADNGHNANTCGV